MREGWPIDFVRCMHCLGAECCRCIPYQRHVIAELSAAAAGCLDARVRHHSRQDYLFDAALLQLEVQVGVGESVLAPMLLNDDVTRLGRELGMPVASPHALSEDALAIGQGLPRARMAPTVIITLSPPPMRNIKHHGTRASCRFDERAQMGEQVDGLSHSLGLGP